MPKPITIKAASITPVLEAARELVMASNAYRWAPSGASETRVIVAENKLASLLGLERDAKTGRYVR